MHLAGEEFRIQRLHTFHESSKSRAAAEQDQCQEQSKELKILMLASRTGFSWSSLEPQLGLALARAARDTLMAEEETVKLRIRECENLLATLKDTLDDTHARVTDAHNQIASIMSFIDQQGIQINLRPLSLPFDPHPNQSLHNGFTSHLDFDTYGEDDYSGDGDSPNEDF
jgi:hypothetical protein